jgi:hypothetical protein
MVIMAKVSNKNLASALRKVCLLNIKDKELICDEIFKEQPNLLGSVIVQQRLGNSLEDIDVLLEILIVLHFSLKEAGIRISKISEREQEHQLRILKETILFSEGLGQHLLKSSVDQYVSNHKEPILLAYVINAMQDAGFFERKEENLKYLIQAGVNLVACIADAEQEKIRQKK